jgi:quinoprotein glucose dehydrogenase
MRTPLALTLGAVLMASAVQAQPSGDQVPAGDWPRFTRDMGGDKYSPLTEIDASNVSRLAPAWSFRVRPDGGGGIVSETTPIVVDDVLYLPIGNAVVAMQADSGKEIWRHPVTTGAVRRAVSYWPGDKDHPARIFFSDGKNLTALDAGTGEIVAGFGSNSVVELDPPYGSPPTIFRNVLIVGANVGELPVGPPGDTRAFDAVTGKSLWVFHTVPRPGERGHETWLNDGWKGRSGTNVWVWYMTLDAKTGVLYMSVGGPSPNYYGGDRPGADLFGNSIVALDAETGRLKWWFQTIHHDLWDSDLPAPPSLVDINVGGKTVPALAETGKAAFMYILNRETGKPVFGVKETPVPAADVPGEWYSPTQPIPTKPQRLVRPRWTPDDVVSAADTNEAHAAACRELLQKYGGTFYNDGPFTPYFIHVEGGPLKASLRTPMNGGSNWGGSAVDPRTGYVFVNISDGGSIGFMETRKKGVVYGRGDEDSPQIYDRASLAGPGAYTSFSASFKTQDGRTASLPCIKPPWGQLYAVNANTGEIAWSSRLGVSDDLPQGKQDTGRYNELGGPIVTAGGLVFIGGTDDRRFRAFDSKTGKEVWTYRLEYNAQSLPITYQGKDGRQYVAIVAAGGAGDKGPDGKPDNNQSLVVFALPR